MNLIIEKVKPIKENSKPIKNNGSIFLLRLELFRLMTDSKKCFMCNVSTF